MEGGEGAELPNVSLMDLGDDNVERNFGCEQPDLVLNALNLFKLF